MRGIGDGNEANVLTRENVVDVLDKVQNIKSVKASKFLQSTSFATDKDLRDIYEALLEEADLDKATITFSEKHHKLIYETESCDRMTNEDDEQNGELICREKFEVRIV